MLALQGYLFVVAAVLTTLAALGQVTVPLLLVFTALLGASTALELPAWQSLVPRLLPREQIPAATRLDMLGVNVTRAVGPALAGLVIAAVGVPAVFGVNALSVLVFAVTLLLWHRPTPDLPPRERFGAAIRAGGRFVRHDHRVRRILVRLAVFVLPATAVWALLPVIASVVYGVGASSYGLMFAALGLGALVGVLALGRVRTHLTGNGLLTVAAGTFAVALAATVLVPSFVAGLALLVVVGLAWVAMISTFNADLQLVLPDWVRARGLAVYVMVFLGTQTAASPVWGIAADGLGVRPAVLLAAAGVGLGALAGLRWPVAAVEDVDPTPVAYWGAAPVVTSPAPDDGPVVVEVDYRVRVEDEAAFLEAMSAMRQSRLRSGATSWGLHRVGERPDHFVELFTVPSWAEHQRQHEGRLTAEDQRIEDAALRWSDPPATARHLLPP